MKRTLETDSDTIPKKLKTENSQCCFPLGIKAIIQEIGKYLEGDYLKNFKLACKTFNQEMKEKSCAIQITPKTLNRTASTPGYHFMKLDGGREELADYITLCENNLYPEVKYLLVDHCGKKKPLFAYDFIFTYFKKIRSLRIIKSIDNIHFHISKDNSIFSLLEIYTSGSITLRLYKNIDKILLCSTEVRKSDVANIQIQLESDEPITYRSNIKCCANKSTLFHDGTVAMPIGYSLESFVPRPDYLVQ